MKQRIAIFFTFLFISIITNQCTKEIPFGTSPPDPLPPKTLPPVTQTGANTFGCKINGQLWVPYYPCEDTWWNGAIELAYSFNSANRYSVLPMSFSMIAENFTDQNSFAIGPIETFYGTGNIIDTLTIGFSNNNGYYSLPGNDPNNIFQITKLDTVNKIISGIFSFTLYASYSDSIVVTDGRFDFQIGQYSRCSN